MALQNYSQLVDRIAKASGKTTDDIHRLVEAKRAKLSGLISREGAAQIVASELNINFDKEKVKIGEIVEGIKKVNVIGKIIEMNPVREYKKENRQGKIGSFLLADETGNIRVVLWDTNHISLIEKNEIKNGDIVEINNSSLRNNELHLTGFSDIKKSGEVFASVQTERQIAIKKISEFGIGGNFKTRAIVVQAFEPKFFHVCPECNTRTIEETDGHRCTTHGKIIPKKRVLMSIVVDDGFGNIRAVLFSEQLAKIGLNEDMEPEDFYEKRKELVGKEAFFSGNVRQNKLFNNQELFVSDIEDINIEKLIEQLENG